MLLGCLLYLPMSVVMVVPAVLGQEASVLYQDTVLFGCHQEYGKMLTKMEKLEVQMEKLLMITEKVDQKMDHLSVRMTNFNMKMNSIEINQQQQLEDKFHAAMDTISSKNRNQFKEEFKNENFQELKEIHVTLSNINETACKVEKGLDFFQTIFKSVKPSAIENMLENSAMGDRLIDKLNVTVLNEAARLYVEKSQGKTVWKKIFAHTTSGGFFINLDDVKSKNPENENADLFSILDQLEMFRDTEGNFQLKVCYPEVQYTAIYPCNEWIQSSNPLHETIITGFKPLRIAFPKTSTGGTFGGLGLSPSSSCCTLIDETPSHANWFFAIGALHNWHKEDTIPGPINQANSDLVAVKKVELFVKI